MISTVWCSTLSYRKAIVRVLWRTIAQNPGTVRLWYAVTWLGLPLCDAAACVAKRFANANFDSPNGT
jgi:hypothetical protein